MRIKGRRRLYLPPALFYRGDFIVMGSKKRLGAAILLGSIGIGIAGLQCGLETRYYTIESTKIEAGQEIRLVMLSDLHSYCYGADQQPLIRRIQQANPDLILLCGDMVDDKAPWEGAQRLFAQITALAPCYYVSGNHEYWSDEPEAIFDMIRAYGINILQNEQHEITITGVRCTVSGLEDPACYGSRTPRAYGSGDAYLNTLSSISKLPDETVHILLAHRPEYMESYALYPFDLVLCGHAHGGQWRIPYLLNGLIAPNQGLFPKYAGGEYHINSMTGIVGRGLLRDWKPRFFNPPEVVVIDLKCRTEGKVHPQQQK